MSTYIDNDFVHGYDDVLAKKIEWWKGQYPNLDFDQFGRAKFAKIESIDENIKYDICCRFNDRSGFRDIFNQYLVENGYRIKVDGGSYYTRLESFEYLNVQDYKTNQLHFKKVDGKCVMVKMSKVFTRCHEVWVEKHPLYKEVIDRIKALRKEGHSYADCPELVSLTEDKKYMDSQTMYAIYEDYMNTHAGLDDIYISVNPFDKLTSSGCAYDNPTGFSSCWSISMYFSDEYHLKAERSGCYSDEKSLLALGSILNCAILYIPNNKTLNVPSSDFSFIGYKERSHVWADAKGLWIEKMYPSKSASRKEEWKQAIAKMEYPLITEDDIYERKAFEVQDTNGIMAYIDQRNRTHQIFLDRVFFDDDDCTLHYLKEDRMNYNYQNGDMFPNDNDEDDGRYIECADCGETIDLDNDSYYTLPNGEIICCDCYDNNYVTCYHCGDIVRTDDATHIRNIDDYYCGYCTNNYAYECEDCGDYITSSNICTVYDENDNEMIVCGDCADEDFTYCPQCDHDHNNDIMTYVESEGESYCSSCHEEYIRVCADCGTEHHIDHMVEIDGKLYCGDCAENHSEESDVAQTETVSV